MLFSLGRPVTFAALLLAFLLALVLRAVAIRLSARTLGLAHRGEPITPRLREDVDPFGAVVAAVAGGGFGKMLSVDEISRRQGRGRAAAVFAAGPVTVLLAAQVVLLAFVLLFGLSSLSVLDAPVGAEFLLGLAVGLLQFGFIALIPMPPLDGFGLLWSAQRQPGQGMQGYRLWFEEKNIGVVVLVVASFFPLPDSLLMRPINALVNVVLRLWGL